MANTANYGWVKPDVGASDDVWGGLLNTDLDGIDSTVKGVSNVANAAYPASNPSGYQTAAQVTTAVTTYPVGDNRLINGNFAVNQRAYVSGTAIATTVYGHDRWKAGAAGCTYTFTAAVPDTTITITAGTLTQIIEAGMIEGGVYTLSWTGTAQARVYQGAPSGSYAASPVTTASLTAGTNTVVEFSAGTITRIKLEIGSVATPYNRQSMARSLADCQRYYQRNGRLYGLAASATTLVVLWPFLVQMRAAPTVTLLTTTPSGESPQFTTPRTGSGSTLTASHLDNSFAVDLAIGGFTGMTANVPASLASSQLAADAEL